MPRDPRPLLFLHVPKTGGTSLRLWLERKLGESPDPGHYLPPTDFDAKRPPKLICGHYDWSAVEGFPFQVRVITMLRDPIDQVRSHYDHLQRGLRDEHQEILERYPTVEAFAQGHSWGRNLQTQRLAGLPDDQLLQADPQHWLSVAKAHLDKCFWFGILDHMDESVDRLRRALCWSTRSLGRFKRANVAENPLWLSDEQRKIVARHNALDLELYDYALARFAATE